MPPDTLPPRHRSGRFKGDYAIAVLVLGACTASAIFLRSRVAITNIAMMYLLGGIIVSVNCRRGIAILSAITGVASFYYFSVPHWNSFVLEDYSYIVILITTLTVSLVITTLMVKIRTQAEYALDREKRTRAMYQLIQELSRETSELGAARVAAGSIGGIFDAQVNLFLTDEQRIVTWSVSASDQSPVQIEDRTFTQSILDNAQKATIMFHTGPHDAIRYVMPLICAGSPVAVMTIVPADRDRLSDADQMRYLETLCVQVAAAIERLKISAAIREAETEIQAERTRNALLNAVSHDIKTPLASIYGAATSLLEEEARLSPLARRELVESISDEAERLNRVVNNLLEMTSLDAGLRAKKDWRPLEEIIGAALTLLEKPLRDRLVTTHIAEDLPWICVDDVLIEQVLLNILDNALKYTPAGAAIEITAVRSGDRVVVSIKDSGPGLAAGEESHVFEKFFRGKTDSVRGVGLGLAICRAIVHGHDGTISAKNSPEGGAVIRFELPIGGVPPQMGVIPETTLP